MELPEDMFRLTDEGIEFIETDINRVKGVNKEKSERFTQAMKNEGIQFPIKNILPPPNQRMMAILWWTIKMISFI